MKQQSIYDLIRSFSPSASGQQGSQGNTSQLAQLAQYLSQQGIQNDVADQQQQRQQLTENDQNNTGENTMQGSSGNDTITGGDSIGNSNAAPPPNLSDALNAFASGRGKVDYNTIMNSSPMPMQGSSPPPGQDMNNALMMDQTDGRSAGASFGHAMAYANQQAQARAQAQNAAMNAHNEQAYKTALALAQESGSLQDKVALRGIEQQKADNMHAYQMGELGQGKFTPLGLDKDGNAMVMNAKTGEVINAGQMNLGNKFNKGGTGASKSLPPGYEVQGLNHLHYLAGISDDKGKPANSPKEPIDIGHEQAILDYATNGLKRGDYATIQQGVNAAVDAAGGINSLVAPKKTPSQYLPWVDNPSRQFSNIDAIRQQREAVSNAAQNIGNSGGASTLAQGGGQKVDDLVFNFMNAHPNATAAQVAKARTRAIQMVGQ